MLQDHYDVEMNCRSKYESLDPKFVMGMLSEVPVQEKIITELAKWKVGPTDSLKRNRELWLSRYPFCIFMPRADYSLQNIYQSPERPSLLDIQRYAMEATEALKHLHDNKLVHLDVKLPNFLLSKSRIKVTDLDAAQKLAESDTFCSGEKSSTSVLPPEMIYRLKTKQDKDRYLQYFREELGFNSETSGDVYVVRKIKPVKKIISCEDSSKCIQLVDSSDRCIVSDVTPRENSKQEWIVRGKRIVAASNPTLCIQVKSQRIEVGAVVEAKLAGEWLTGVITRQRRGKTFDVIFDNGQEERWMKRIDIQPVLSCHACPIVSGPYPSQEWVFDGKQIKSVEHPKMCIFFTAKHCIVKEPMGYGDQTRMQWDIQVSNSKQRTLPYEPALPSISMDIWSLGIMLYKLRSRQVSRTSKGRKQKTSFFVLCHSVLLLLF